MADIADPNSAGFDEVTHQPTPSKSRTAQSCPNGSVPHAKPAVGASPSPPGAQQPWRVNTPPRTLLDAEDRRDGRATTSPKSLALLIELEQHRNRLQWHHMFRNLVFYGGIIALTAAFAFLLTVAHFSAQEATRITTYGLVGALGGYGLSSLKTKILPWRSSRDEKKDQDKSLSRGLTSVSGSISLK
jgi:hypothetical protein